MNFYFFILWIIMFSRKNCVYSFFCCSFSESLYTKDYLSGIFFNGYHLIMSAFDLLINAELNTPDSVRR